ncbi:hypothetical protein CEE34_00675 [Candidatus Aerophobetes bacterium Ae_b3a]|nr:MAG: hypothetical protein CEE34_00675 [Candidatus Aerophobetes bacterium Ae_b3a]
MEAGHEYPEIEIFVREKKEKETAMKTRIRFLLIVILFSLISPTVVACTSFILDNNGFAVFGANFDNRIHEGLLFINKRNVAKTLLDPGTTGEYAEWTSKYGSVTFNVVGYQFAYAGMNEAGLVISTMALDITENPAPDERAPLETAIWVQYQLDNASTTQEVIASDSVVRIANTTDHYLVSDKTGSSAAIEFIEGKMVVHTDEAMPVKALTNNTYEESVSSWEKSRWWMFWRLLEKRFWKSSLIRFETAADRVRSFNDNGKDKAVEYAFDTLKKTCDDAESNPTQWSMVFDTENLKIHFHTRTNPEVRSITLTMLDFSCTTPVGMLDIHQDLSGDISNDFMPYSPEVNLNHFLRFFEEYGLVDISPEETKELTEHLESFECSELKE